MIRSIVGSIKYLIAGSTNTDDTSVPIDVSDENLIEAVETKDCTCHDDGVRADEQMDTVEGPVGVGAGTSSVHQVKEELERINKEARSETSTDAVEHDDESEPMEVDPIPSPSKWMPYPDFEDIEHDIALPVIDDANKEKSSLAAEITDDGQRSPVVEFVDEGPKSPVLSAVDSDEGYEGSDEEILEEQETYHDSGNEVDDVGFASTEDIMSFFNGREPTEDFDDEAIDRFDTCNDSMFQQFHQNNLNNPNEPEPCEDEATTWNADEGFDDCESDDIVSDQPSGIMTSYGRSAYGNQYDDDFIITEEIWNKIKAFEDGLNQVRSDVDSMASNSCMTIFEDDNSPLQEQRSNGTGIIDESDYDDDENVGTDANDVSDDKVDIHDSVDIDDVTKAFSAASADSLKSIDFKDISISSTSKACDN